MIAAFLVAGMCLGQSQQARVFAVDPAKSRLHYFIDHAMHKVEADSLAVEGKAVGRPDGLVQLMVRAAVASFKSGDSNRDVHMQEVVQAAQFPWVVFKSAHRLDIAAQPTSVDLKLAGELEFHGRKKIETIPVHVELTPTGELHVTGSFTFSLEGYGIERPSLLFVKLKDTCRIDFNLTLTEQKS